MFKFNNSLKKFIVGGVVILPLTATATIHTISSNVVGGLGSNFTMLTPAGADFGDAATDVTGTFDDSKICTVSACNDFAMTLSSAQTFFGVLWTAHAVRVFAPGTYTIDTDCTEQDFLAGRYNCDPSAGRGFLPYPNGDPAVTDASLPSDGQEGPNITFTVAPGQLGAHIMFDWNGNTNIHVPVVWDYNQTFTVPTDPLFPLIDQTVIYNGSNGDGVGNTLLCTAVGIGTKNGVSGSYPQCDTTHTASRVYKFASRDGNSTAIVDRWDTAIPGVPTTSGTEPDGVRGFAMLNGPFPGQSANFNLDMTPGYTPPVAADDNGSTVIDTLVVIDVLANDSDAEDGAPPVGVTVTLLDNGNGPNLSTKGGALVNNGDGTVDYDPTLAGLVDLETDTFTYTVTDSIGVVSNVATVTVTATAAPNAVPVANNVEFSTNEDVAKLINIAANDINAVSVAIDGDSDPLTFVSVDALTALGGAVVVEAGSQDLTYTPPSNVSGTDTFNFSVNDGLANSNVATMTINVAPVNDNPVCTDVTLSTDTNASMDIDVATVLLVGCSDIDGGTPAFDSVASQPVIAGGNVADNGSGLLVYTPATDYTGDDSFTFIVNDGQGGSVTVTALIKVGTIFSNFTMLDSSGNVFGGTNDVVFDWDGTTFNTDEADTNFGVMTIISSKPQPFFSFLWSAHHIRVYGPGSYTFDATCTTAQYDAGTTTCSGSKTISMTVGAGQVGAHILFDWGKPDAGSPCGRANCDIDVVNVWNQNAAWDRLGATGTKNQLFDGQAGLPPEPTTTWVLVSTDVNGDGINGSPMVDGPFEGFYANFNSTPGAVGAVKEPLPYSQQDTELGSSLLASMNPLVLFAGLFGLLGLRHLTRKNS